MAVISVFNEKGGSGKTMTTVHLAMAAFMAGRKVAILDLDPMGSATEWREDRGDLPGPTVVKVPVSALDRAVAAAKADGFDFVLIDAPPGVSAMAVKIVAAADFVLIPVRPQRFDMRAVPATVKLVGRKPYAFLQSDCPQRAPEIATRRQELLAYARPVLGPIHNWRAYWRAVEKGRVVMETEPDSEPAADIHTLYQSVLKEIA